MLWLDYWQMHKKKVADEILWLLRIEGSKQN